MSIRYPFNLYRKGVPLAQSLAYVEITGDGVLTQAEAERLAATIKTLGVPKPKPDKA